MTAENSFEEQKIEEPGQEEVVELYTKPDGTTILKSDYDDEMERRKEDPTRWRDTK